jgi:malate synthase
MEVFNEKMPQPNQLDRRRDDVTITSADITEPLNGDITENGLRHNISVGVQYLESWLRGNGCVPLYHLMEDAATAEISRSQIWQWIKHNAKLSDGTPITEDLFRTTLAEELEKIRSTIGPDLYNAGAFAEAADIFGRISTDQFMVEFLTTPAYDYLQDAPERGARQGQQ